MASNGDAANRERSEKAYHEAGHAFAAHVLGIGVKAVSIYKGSNGWKGDVVPLADADSNILTEYLLSGDAAVEYFFPDSADIGSSSQDWKDAERQARKVLGIVEDIDRILLPAQERNRLYNLLTKAKDRAKAAVVLKHGVVQQIAEELLQTEEISQGRFSDIMGTQL